MADPISMTLMAGMAGSLLGKGFAGVMGGDAPTPQAPPAMPAPASAPVGSQTSQKSTAIPSFLSAAAPPASAATGAKTLLGQ